MNFVARCRKRRGWHEYREQVPRDLPALWGVLVNT